MSDEKYLGLFSHASLATFISDDPLQFKDRFNKITAKARPFIDIEPKPVFYYYQSQKYKQRIYVLSYWESPEHRIQFREHEKSKEVMD